MSFTDIPYYVCLVPLLYASLLLKKDLRWLVLLGFSLFFYGNGRWYYLILLIGSTFVDYICAINIDSSKSILAKRLLLTVSIVANLSVLFFFKYFLTLYQDWSWIELRSAPLIAQLSTVALPLGISFYTLQSMGYTIDVYRKEIKPEKHFGLFALYVCFFPQLVAGPIERARKLLPQLRNPANITLENIQSGLLLIIFGLAQKLIIADRLFVILDAGLKQPDGMLGWQAVSFGTLALFALYMDLSAYTNIARGSARLFGIELSHNFNRPFIVRSIGEFWQSWHISLTSWIQNYIYKSLCSISRSPVFRYAALIFTFITIGLWHGATYPFILFGMIQGCIIVIERLVAKHDFMWPKNRSMNILRVVRTHILFNLMGVIFLSPNIESVVANYQSFIYHDSFFGSSSYIGHESYIEIFSIIGLGTIGVACVEYFKNASVVRYFKTVRHSAVLNFLLIYSLLMVVLFFSYRRHNEFFYFNF